MLQNLKVGFLFSVGIVALARFGIEGDPIAGVVAALVAGMVWSALLKLPEAIYRAQHRHDADLLKLKEMALKAQEDVRELQSRVERMEQPFA